MSVLAHQEQSSKVITGTILNTGTQSAAIDLGDIYEWVVIDIDAAEVAKMGVAAELQLLIGDNHVYLEDGSGIWGITKPGSGGIYVTVHAKGARNIKVESSVAVTADMTFRVRGVGSMVFSSGVPQRYTI